MPEVSEVEDLFIQAYHLSVVEKKHRKAINLCRKALKIQPEHFRTLVFLGMLLGDHGRGQEIAEARELFMTAIEKAESASCFCTTWPEEAAIHHLGVWEWSQRNYLNASFFFLIDAFVCNNKESGRYLNRLLAEEDVPVARDIQLILKRLGSQYKVVPKQS